jgi:ribosomal protein S18 acetylase RimI-like enzyme
MNQLEQARIRPMTAADVARLVEIDANFESHVYLDVHQETQGLNASWRLIQRPLNPPFVCTDFVFDKNERREIRRRQETGDGLWLLAEGRGGRLLGLADVERQAWREAAWVWNLAVDRAYRGQGLGRRLMERIVQWGRDQSLRAVILETQTNNWPACCFYQHFGFRLCGLNDHYYTNHDVADKEVALFWTYEL